MSEGFSFISSPLNNLESNGDKNELNNPVGDAKLPSTTTSFSFLSTPTQGGLEASNVTSTNKFDNNTTKVDNDSDLIPEHDDDSAQNIQNTDFHCASQLPPPPVPPQEIKFAKTSSVRNVKKKKKKSSIVGYARNDVEVDGDSNAADTLDPPPPIPSMQGYTDTNKSVDAHDEGDSQNSNTAYTSVFDKCCRAAHCTALQVGSILIK